MYDSPKHFRTQQQLQGAAGHHLFVDLALLSGLSGQSALGEGMLPIVVGWTSSSFTST